MVFSGINVNELAKKNKGTETLINPSDIAGIGMAYKILTIKNFKS